MEKFTSEAVERAAKAAFDAEPHCHPRGLVPDWDAQPQHLKDIFRRRVMNTNQE